jgi:hypothetical protein
MAAFSGTGPTLPRELEYIRNDGIEASAFYAIDSAGGPALEDLVRSPNVLSFAFSFCSSFAFEVLHLTDNQ